MVWLLAVACIFCFVIFLIKYRSWKKSRGDRARISFKRFYELYSKNPWRWTLYDNYVQLYNFHFKFNVEFGSYLDVLRYKRFRKKITKEKQKEKQESNQKDLEKELEKMREEVKEDGKQ